jgi:glycosyltransferase involved in cell wall biosynthesis
MLESVAFAARSTMTRSLGLFKKHVNVFAPPSKFVKSRLVAAGFPENRIKVVPNMVPVPRISGDAAEGQYIALAGRFSEEKGIETLLEAAKRLPHVPVRIAGEGPLSAKLRAMAPSSVTFTGQLTRDALGEFYANARACVVPSRWYEAFGLVAAEAMSYAIPVIATNMAGLAEIVDHGTTGFHFTSDNAAELAGYIDQLWSDPRLARSLGVAGRKKVEREYSEQTYYLRLMGMYQDALGVKAAAAPAAGLARTA